MINSSFISGDVITTRYLIYVQYRKRCFNLDSQSGSWAQMKPTQYILGSKRADFALYSVPIHLMKASLTLSITNVMYYVSLESFGKFWKLAQVNLGY